MSGVMAVVFNGVGQLEYRRERALSTTQQRYLDSMDEKMANGVDLGGVWIAAPELGQKAQFVAMQLYRALADGREQQAAAMCSYLADRLPDLKQVNLREKGGQVAVDLVFTDPARNSVHVNFKKMN